MLKKNCHKIFITITILAIISIILLNPNSVLNDYVTILTSPSILLTDYISIASIEATFLNAIITTFASYLLVRILKQEISAPIIAAFFMIFGFSFFGKNIIGVTPLYLGVFLYSKINKIQVKAVIITLLFSSGISSLVSFLLFGTAMHFLVAIPVALLIGMVVGYLVPILNAHTLRFHQGYNLYASGFSMGLLSLIVYGVLLALGINVNRPILTIDFNHQIFLYSLLFTLGVILTIVGFLKKDLLNNYKKILNSSGRLITDYFRISNISTTLFNMGTLALLCSVTALVLQFQMSGALFGTIIAVVGFGTFGKNSFTCAPILLGAILAVYFFPSLSFDTGTTIAIFFATALAPMTKEFGIFGGMLVGAIHVIIISLTLNFQGGFDLYNNGFSTGFIAAICVPVFESLKRNEVKN